MTSKYVHDSFVHNTKAAEKIVPFLVDTLNCSSVIDVGCGTGTWLKVFMDLGLKDVLGVEGFHLDKQKLVIPQDQVLLHDLELPLSVPRKFDLAISLEVAEHLDKSVADQFVKDLTLLSDVILFSGAIPLQGGQNHINEQWQTYWISIFASNQYSAHDVIRPAFWNDQAVEYWYKQNAILFIKNSSQKSEAIRSLRSFYAMDIIHPELYLKKTLFLVRIQKGKAGVFTAGKMMIKSLLNFFKGAGQ